MNKTKTKLAAAYGCPKKGYFHFDAIKRYFTKKDNNTAYQVLSDKTCADLDFEELFMFVDRTTTKIGQQYLYNRLRVIEQQNPIDSKREELISKFQSDEAFRLKTQLLINKQNKGHAYYLSSLFQDTHESPPGWFSIVPVLSFASLAFLIMIVFQPKFILLFMLVFCVNMGIHYWNKQMADSYSRSLPQLLRLNNIAAQLHKEKQFAILAPDLKRSMNVIAEIAKKMLLFKVEADMQGEFKVVVWGALELIKAAFLLEPLFLYDILKALDAKRKEIENVFSFVGEIDCLISIASLRAGLDSYCIPVIEDTELAATDIYHPVIPACVTNTIKLTGNSVLLTGSNMSGKTTFIRTIGLNVIAGLTLNTCFAKELTLPRLQIYSAIRISDDLMNNKSYYFEEVTTIKELLDRSTSGQRNLFLLDEIFKGTNTVERISGGKAVLSALARNNNLVFVSTHDIELTDLLADSYEQYHFSEIVDNSSVGFDYKLKEGKLRNRNAIRILELNGYPDAVIAEAKMLAQKLDGNEL